MEKLALKQEELYLQEIFQHKLSIEESSRPISSLFSPSNKFMIISDPYYQRNYVWDEQKASFFIESVLLGIDIPPLIFFKKYNGKIEIIDGRQRYETLGKFIDDKFSLKSNGLTKLSFMSKKKFKDLDDLLKTTLLDTYLRVIEFSFNTPDITENIEDKIKKEIFRRYNSGITPPKEQDIDRARYINDRVTIYFKKKLSTNDLFLDKINRLFISDKKEINSRLDYFHELQAIRQLIERTHLPVSYFAAPKKAKIIKLYEEFTSDILDLDKYYKIFDSILDVCIKYKEKYNEENKLIFEVLFWALSILVKEKVKESSLFELGYDSEISLLIGQHSNYWDLGQSHFYKNVINRYKLILTRLFDLYGLKNANEYIYAQFSKIKSKIQTIDTPNESLYEQIVVERSYRPNAGNIPIETIIEDMKKNRFYIRPEYQRDEVMDIVKASRLIESIILGMKLPSIFVHKRVVNKTIIKEVVDGQQRLLAILAFMGEKYLNQDGNFEETKKHSFKLKSPLLIENLQGKYFSDLDDQLKLKITRFVLTVVEIDQSFNPNFVAEDLYIRLNNKPYPIKEHTFEMWNSYIDRDIIDEIKRISTQFSEWFYCENNNKRMKNEDLIAYLGYLQFSYKNLDDDKEVFTSLLDFYQREESDVSIRLRKKLELSKILDKCKSNDKIKNEFKNALKEVEKNIRILENLLIDENVFQANKNQYLSKKLNDSIFHFQSTKKSRPFEYFYLLWLLLFKLKKPQTDHYRSDLTEDISNIFLTWKERAIHFSIDKMKSDIYSYWEKYRVSPRVFRLTEEEILQKIGNQSNICPRCTKNIYLGSVVEVDHIVPIALGGSDDWDNLQVIHKECNRKKGAKLTLF